ncbi:MAG: diguanylate cyclase [Solirubrobacteraceae bacterium]
MRLWLTIIAAVLVVAGGVLYASEVQRTTAEENFDEVQLAHNLRTSMLQAELSLDQGLAGLGAESLPAIRRAEGEVQDALDDLDEVVADDAEETAMVVAQRGAAKSWHAAAADEVTELDQPARTRAGGLDDRTGPLEDFLRANDRLASRLNVNRDEETSAAALVPVKIVILLSALFLLAGGLFVRRDTQRRRQRAAAGAARRESAAEFIETQRRLSEALQAAGDQREAHQLLRGHLQRWIPESVVHILNRNNSADRLESSTELDESSPLAAALETAEPRSCIAVRLSRPFERAQTSTEVLECELCGKLAGETSCRPLLVGGEVIGSVLVERQGGLGDDETRRIDESVTSAAPVLANLRNLAIAEMRAATDSLTGLPNRRSLDDTIKRMLAQSSRSMNPMAVVQIDLDHFKQINDTFGHERGDTVLAGFGALLRSSLRASDFAARSGGEEFVLLLPETDRQGALKLTEKLRRSVHALRAEGVDRRITTSIGVSVFPDDAVDEQTLMRLADRALYTAKQHGRDRVETVSELGSGSPEPAG